MAKTSISPPKAATLLKWYHKHARDLPWRSENGRAPTPYHTWLSEIMLQQTTVVTVIPYYLRFITKWPTVKKLAAATDDEVLLEWAGLGYYSRARNLLKCARIVASEHNGVFPSEITELKKLPGIGEYTANAIRAIAFDLPANVMDGNVERVVSRIFAYKKPLNIPAHKNEVRTLAASLAPQENCGDYAQALMDLGATICTPRNPLCHSCPWQKNCQAFALDIQKELPIIERRAKLPQRHADIFVMRDTKGRYFLRQRPDKGLLANLWEFPSSPWSDKNDTKDGHTPPLPLTKFTLLPKPVVHVFTHFKLELSVYVAHDAVSKLTEKGQWFDASDLPALPTLMKKVMAAADKLR